MADLEVNAAHNAKLLIRLHPLALCVAPLGRRLGTRLRRCWHAWLPLWVVHRDQVVEQALVELLHTPGCTSDAGGKG